MSSTWAFIFIIEGEYPWSEINVLKATSWAAATFPIASMM